MSEANRTLAIRWFEEVWNNADESAVAELASPTMRCHGFPEPDSVIDAIRFKAAVRNYQSIFSGIHITPEETIVEGDRVAVRWTARMTHTGPGLGFAPTGLPVTLPGTSIMHMRDGRIYASWNTFDLTAIISRLSAIAGDRRESGRLTPSR